MSFDINVELVQFHKVSVSESEAAKLAFEWIYMLYGLPVDSYLKFGYVCVQGQLDLDIQIRPQTDKDAECFRIIDDLKQQNWDRSNNKQQ